MKSASSTALIIPLLRLMVFMLVMLFMEKVHMAIIIILEGREREAMGRGNVVLQRKLEEVESGIERLLEHPPPTYIHDDDSLYRTAQKIDFIKNLLTAEINSCSSHRPENLNRLATRLSIVQKAFVDWASPTSRFSKLDEILANWVEAKVNEKVGEKKQEAETVQKRKVLAEKKGRKRKQQCRGMKSYMAMGYAAGFTSALILVALANIPYIEETVYFVPT